MPTKRKSYRAKKDVNYTDSTSNSNYESEDDFENEFEPRPKKIKSNQVITKDARKSGKVERKTPLKRLSVEEKLYKRDIDKAIRISLSNPTSIDEEKNVDGEDNASKSEAFRDNEPRQKTTIQEGAGENYDEKQGSDYSEDEGRRTPASKRSKLEKAQTIGDNKKLTEKGQSVAPSVKIPAGNINLRSLGLGGVQIKKPGPPLRVGLSRYMKVKPLHSKVPVSH
ncbi:uncharacterized protein LOC114534416 [Dendronephthya gigantea]|uniref:uncharacterized protein LOC114534416 n=1 Tax=Dendronephthya gigantea TaxID=151771 RepID=UPI00106B89FC|nr:uncharacterized protein LOC114534416 [Dendronephthya gigantea]